MIELNLSADIINTHKNWIFGENKLKPDRLYNKLKNIKESETDTEVEYIYNFIYKNIEEIITGDLDTLNNLIQEYETSIQLLRLKDTDNIRKVRKRDLFIGEKERLLMSTLKDIFEQEYKYFYSSTGWNAYIFLDKLNLSICPYCGSQYVFLYNQNGKKTRSTLDHFFDKATYPFLAVSIYNLVPSCKVCNSDFKNTHEMNLDNFYSPYEKKIIENCEIAIDVIDIKKTQKIKNDNSEIDYYEMFIGNSSQFNIKFHINSTDEIIKNKIRGNIELFRLEDLYNKYHKSYVKSILRKSYIYNKVYINYLKTSFELIFVSEDDLKSAIYPSVEDDKNFILGKLTRDIAKKQLDFLNSQSIEKNKE